MSILSSTLLFYLLIILSGHSRPCAPGSRPRKSSCGHIYSLGSDQRKMRGCTLRCAATRIEPHHPRHRHLQRPRPYLRRPRPSPSRALRPRPPLMVVVSSATRRRRGAAVHGPASLQFEWCAASQKITVEPPGPRTSHAAAALVAPCTAPRRAFLIPHQRRVSSALPPIPHGDAPMAHRDAPVAPRDAPVHRDAAMAHRSAPMAHREALPLAH